jgi:SRSO17 transposase
LPVGYRRRRNGPRTRCRKKAGIPDDVVFATKPAIALGLLKQALAEKAPPGFVLTDAAYGADTAFREAVSELGLAYAMGTVTSVWPRGSGL